VDLNQITVPSINLEKAASFYKKLGLILIVDSIPRYARFECPVGNSTFSLHQVEALPKGEGISIYFECAELDKQVEELLHEGFQFDEMPEDKKWHWREARLKDPDGNQIILFHAGENRKNPPWRIKS
jgi:catechol 2,3-dioxygenase-like lactoylglutathione lyase family enzyme